MRTVKGTRDLIMGIIVQNLVNQSEIDPLDLIRASNAIIEVLTEEKNLHIPPVEGVKHNG